MDRLLADWRLEARERAALNVMLAVLFQVDANQAVGSVIFKEKQSGIYYAKATGKVQLRPRLCRGPKRPNEEVTFLVRAEERGGDTIPADAADRASALMKAVAKDEALRQRFRPDPLGAK
jgi:hypothetical protein